jgi:RNA polymerase sigma-70 factor (ECF subfamily)
VDGLYASGVAPFSWVRGVAGFVTRPSDPNAPSSEVGAARVGADAAEAKAAEDSELVRRCLQGEERAFERLFLRHRVSVTALVHRLLGPSPELEDLVQDVFVQVLRTLSTFRDEARFSTWLYRVALNVVLMHRRSRGRRPRLVAEELALPAIDAAPSAQDVLESRRRVATFYQLLERLSEKKRTVFVLHELEGLPPTRIAELVQSPVLTVRTRLFYARRELTQLIAAEPALAGELSLEAAAVTSDDEESP